jgi:hypothetical protein
MNRKPKLRVGSIVRCYRAAPFGRVGVVRAARYTGSAMEYRVEWTDGKTAAGVSTWVRAVNIFHPWK